MLKKTVTFWKSFVTVTFNNPGGEERVFIWNLGVRNSFWVLFKTILEENLPIEGEPPYDRNKWSEVMGPL